MHNESIFKTDLILKGKHLYVSIHSISLNVRYFEKYSAHNEMNPALFSRQLICRQAVAYQ